MHEPTEDLAADAPQVPDEGPETVVQQIPPTVLQQSAAERKRLSPLVGDIPREIPVRLGKYLIDAEIGRGAMGVVYRARQDGLDRIVALKLLLRGPNAGDAHKRRFEREARAIAKLRHPHIVSIHEVGEYEGQPFFTMDYIDGMDLDTFMEKNGITSTSLVADMCARICEAVQYAHEHGIIHRDLKPGNILVDRAGDPIVMDFGLAKDMDSDSIVSMAGDIMGTPAFMSPEQAGGHVAVTAERSDVYSLGAILYCMLTRQPPFQGKTLMETLGRVMNEDPPPLTMTNPDIEGELGAICMKAMDKVPALRYDTAKAMADDLRAFINGTPISARPWTLRTRIHRFIRRRGREAAAVVVVAGLLVWVAVLVARIVSTDYLDVALGHLESADTGVRAQAVATLAGEVRDPRQLPADRIKEAAALLLSMRADPEPDVVTALLAFLAEHGDTDAIRPHITPEIEQWLVEMAEQNETPEARNHAIEAMGRIPRGTFIDYLLVRLKVETSPTLKLKLVRSLGRQRSIRIVAPLTQIMIRDPVCRAEAALNTFYREGRVTLFDSQDRAVRATMRSLSESMAKITIASWNRSSAIGLSRTPGNRVRSTPIALSWRRETWTKKEPQPLPSRPVANPPPSLCCLTPSMTSTPAMWPLMPLQNSILTAPTPRWLNAWTTFPPACGPTPRSPLASAAAPRPWISSWWRSARNPSPTPPKTSFTRWANWVRPMRFRVCAMRPNATKPSAWRWKRPSGGSRGNDREPGYSAAPKIRFKFST
jgi:predicted Ser/Thr protein kinase